MDIIKWKPFEDANRFFEEDFFPVIPAISKKTVPSMNIYQTKDEVAAEVSLVGIDPKNVKVTIENDILTVEGKDKEEKETKEKDYYRKEIRSGSFTRSVSLPVHVKGDKASAESKNGILRITVPKVDKKIIKEIPIKIGK